jgi:hypothetical protein
MAFVASNEHVGDSLTTTQTTAINQSVAEGSTKSLHLFQTPCHDTVTQWYNTEATNGEREMFRTVVRSIMATPAGSSIQNTPARSDNEGKKISNKFKVWAESVVCSKYRQSFLSWLKSASPHELYQLTRIVSALSGRHHIHSLTQSVAATNNAVTKSTENTAKSSKRSPDERHEVSLDSLNWNRSDSEHPVPFVKKSSSPPVVTSMKYSYSTNNELFKPTSGTLLIENYNSMRSRNRKVIEESFVPYAKAGPDWVETPRATTSMYFPSRTLDERRGARQVPLVDHKKMFFSKAVHGPVP